MNTLYRSKNITLLTLAILFSLLTGCAATKVYEPLETLKTQYNTERSEGIAKTHAPVTLYETEKLIQKAETAANDNDTISLKHYTYLGEKTLEMAKAKAKSKQNEERIQALNEQRNQVLLDSRSEEVKRSRDDAEKLRQELEVYKSKKSDRGTVLILDNLLFDTGGATLHPGSQKNLDPLVNYLNKYSERKISIEGHTDNVGGDEFNQQLSYKRANAVKQYLLFSGIDAFRIITKGFGESLPVASNNTSEGRQLNRRVEIVILD